MSIQAMQTNFNKSGAHAVVMGGSIAGLLAARVLMGGLNDQHKNKPLAQRAWKEA